MVAKFNKGCLKQSNNFAYDNGSRVSIYIVYELGASSSNYIDPTPKKCLFGAVILTKNADIEKMGILVIELDLIKRKFFISRWWIWSKYVNFRGRYEFFCSY